MLRFKTTYFKYKYLLYFFALVAGWPCIFYLLDWLPFFRTNYIILFSLVVLFALTKNAYRYVPKTIRIILLVQIIVWLLYLILYSDSSYLTRVFLLLITFSLLAIQLSYSNKYEFIKTFNFWLVLQSVAGSIGFFLVLLGILNPISEFIQMDGRLGYFYGLFTTNAVFDGYIRNAGFYDEPGSLACWGIFALLLNKLFIGNKRVEYLLIFGLITTFSMAYFIQICAYLFLFYKNQRKKVFLWTFLFFMALLLFSTINQSLSEAIFGRFYVNAETGFIVGDNRSELFLKCWNIFSSSPIIGVGANNLATVYAEKEGFLGANFFVNFASDGFIGAIISFLPLLYLLKLGLHRRQYFYAFIIILLGYLQRPYTETQLLYPLLLYTLLLHAYFDVYLGNFLQKKSRKNYIITNEK